MGYSVNVSVREVPNFLEAARNGLIHSHHPGSVRIQTRRYDVLEGPLRHIIHCTTIGESAEHIPQILPVASNWEVMNP
jgi:hypothetical protein